jgi:photosystem II stability/assembly factor-like uncharacterized protein
MKKIIFVFVIILFVTNLYSQSGWVLINPFPNTNESIKRFFFSDQITGYTINYSNSYTKLYKTTNSGLNWINIVYSTDQSWIGALYFQNNLTGYYSQLSSGLFRTTNGGINWLYKSMYYSNAITFVNDTIGYGVSGSEFGGVLQKTFDGGNTWYKIYNTNIPGSYDEINDIKFFNANTGLICGEMDYLLRTTNGGQNWNLVYPSNYGIFYSISILNKDTAYVVGNGNRILQTINQGLNWTVSTLSDFYLYKIEFVDSNTGFIGGNSKLFKTTNKGINWNIIKQGDYYSWSQFFNNNSGYIYQAFGNLLKTSNGGLNWYTDVPTIDTFKTLYMMNENTGFCGGINGNLYKTTNGLSFPRDVKWNIIKNFNGSRINDIYFVNSQKGLILSDSGKFYITLDSTHTWSTLLTGVNSNLNRVCFLNDSIGISIGTRGVILRTSNSGLNWTPVNGNYLFDLKGICYIPSGNIFICGDSSVILKSINSGNNWFSMQTPSLKHLNSIAFKNDNLGYIVGDSGTTYRTTNGGSIWEFINIYSGSLNLNFITWYCDTLLCIVGDNNLIRMSRNNGLTWGTPVSEYLYQGHINKIQFINNNFGFLCGNRMMIQRTIDGGGPLTNIINNNFENISTSFILSQNFPNPFNPVTKIKFNIPASDNIHRTLEAKLIIYDILGKQIVTLVNEKLQPGTYEVEWNASRFSSGVYFYRLTTDGFSETKKMILLK